MKKKWMNGSVSGSKKTSSLSAGGIAAGRYYFNRPLALLMKWYGIAVCALLAMITLLYALRAAGCEKNMT